MNRFEQIKNADQQYMMGTYAKFDLAICSGKGAVATDESGKEYIDFGSGIGVNSLGYCEPGWVAAVTKQLNTLQHTSNLYYEPSQIRLGELLSEKTGFSKVFMCNSGAEANECAIKIARKYSADKYSDARSNIITLSNSFHGRTITTLSTTGQNAFHQHFQPLTKGFKYVTAEDVSALESAIDESVCAVMIETVQGEGGVVPISENYIKAVARACKERDLLFIIDEVQTGVGRTGKLFAWENSGIRPDVLTTAKGLGGGLPIGACMCTERLASVLGPGHHGSTFGGNPVACAGAAYVVEKVSQPEFLQAVCDKGDYIKSRVESMPHIKSVRGIGLMRGIMLDDGCESRAIAEQCIKSGLIILTAKTLLRIMPPLNITMAEIDNGLDILENVLSNI